MEWTRDEDPSQMELTEVLERPMTNAERQRKWRKSQKEKHGRSNATFNVTEDEKFFLERVLLSMRKTGGIPATLRDPNTGRMIEVDL